MQVEVPITLTTSPSCHAGADRVPMRIERAYRNRNARRRPSLAAHSADSVPAIESEVRYWPPSLPRTPLSSGSTDARKPSGGRPPSDSFHIHLWPIAQMLRGALATLANAA